MPAENSLVLLDLNNPNFLKSLFALEKNDKIRLFKQLEKISKLTWTDVQRDPGLKWGKKSSCARLAATASSGR